MVYSLSLNLSVFTLIPSILSSSPPQVCYSTISLFLICTTVFTLYYPRYPSPPTCAVCCLTFLVSLTHPAVCKLRLTASSIFVSLAPSQPLFPCMSASPSIRLFFSQGLYLSISLLPRSLSVCVLVILSAGLNLGACCVSLSVYFPVCLSLHLFVSVSVCLSICLYLRLPAPPTTCPSFCLCLRPQSLSV